MKVCCSFTRVARTCVSAGLLLLAMAVAPAARGQDPAEKPAADAPAAEAPDEAAPADQPDAPDAEEGSDDPTLLERQRRLAAKYEQLEAVLRRNADLEMLANPQRAALLRRATEQSSERFTRLKMDKIVSLLERKSYSEAIGNQGETVIDLQALLKLLLSEDRPDRLRSEQDRIKEYIKELERLIRIQRGLQGQAEGNGDTEEIAQAQGENANRTDALQKKIGEDEGDSQGENEGDSKGDSEGDSKGNSEGDSKGNSEGDSKGDSEGDSKGNSEGDSKGDSEGDSKGNSEGDSKGDSEGDSKGNSEGDSKGNSEGDSKGDSEGDSKGNSEGDSKGDSEGGSKGNSEGDSKGMSEGDSKGNSEGDSKGNSEGDSKGNSEGDSKGDSEGDSKGNSEGDSKGDSSGDSKGDSSGDSKGDSEGGQNSDDNPARKRIKAAEQKMREAQQKLEDAKRREAIEDQEEAKRLLEQAKAELEEILRQLREEEIERMLALLESRFTKMLEMQIAVYEDTARLDKTPADQRNEQRFVVSSGRLAFAERKIVIEADKALHLLLEEGSSVAFPEATEQIRDDMEMVATRLEQTQTGSLTQDIELEIIAALQDMVDALKKAQQEQESESEPGPPPPPGPPQDQALVDKIAELKMIRSLQVRVNSRTKRYSRLLNDSEDIVGQATDQDLRSAIQQLGDREQRIHAITRDIVLGKNK